MLQGGPDSVKNVASAPRRRSRHVVSAARRAWRFRARSSPIPHRGDRLSSPQSISIWKNRSRCALLPPSRRIWSWRGASRSTTRACSPRRCASAASQTGNDHIGDRRRGPQSAVGGDLAQRGEEASGGRVASGRGQCEHQMRHQQQMAGVADACLGLVGQFLPAVADIDAELFQPPQQARWHSADRRNGPAPPWSSDRRSCGCSRRSWRAPRRARRGRVPSACGATRDDGSGCCRRTSSGSALRASRGPRAGGNPSPARAP